MITNKAEGFNYPFSDDISKYSLLLARCIAVNSSTGAETERGVQILIPAIQIIKESTPLSFDMGAVSPTAGNSIYSMIYLDKTMVIYFYAQWGDGPALTNPKFKLKVFGIK